MSKSRQGKGVGERNGMSKREHREILSTSLKMAWLGDKGDVLRKKAGLVLKDTHSKGKIKNLPISKAEKLIGQQLQSRFDYVISQKSIESKKFDYYVPSLRLLIEYNGDYWHCNPSKYSPDYFNQKKKKFAFEIWKYDEEKLDLAKKNLYNIVVVWESEHRNNPDILFEKINEIQDKCPCNTE
jgi:hypothetical protein